jgi:biotin carboxyl carrier protein
MQQSEAKLLTRQQRIKSLEAKIEAIELKVSIADIERGRDRNLAAAQAGTQKAAFDSESIYKNLKAELNIAKADLAEAKATLGEVETERNYSQKLLDKKNIYAPADGMVLSWDSKLGQAVSVGTKLGDFAPAGELMLRLLCEGGLVSIAGGRITLTEPVTHAGAGRVDRRWDVVGRGRIDERAVRWQDYSKGRRCVRFAARLRFTSGIGKRWKRGIGSPISPSSVRRADCGRRS